MGTVTQRHSYRKRLAAFGLILVGLRDVVMRKGLKGRRDGGRVMRRERWRYLGKKNRDS